MYEPSRHLSTFFIAGFQFWEGTSVIETLKIGDKLTLQSEPENPHDPNATALYFKKYKLGFIPSDRNNFVSLVSYFGHAAVFDLRVVQVNPLADPWKQVRVGLFVKDAR